MLLRMSPRTVSEIAARLGLTDNAIRAHLLTLERDGLVEQKGAVKGFRKPHYTYGLTDEARHLFPKPYAFILNRLIDALKKSLPQESLTSILRDVGRDIGGAHRPETDDLDGRLDEAIKALDVLGGAAQIVKDDGNVSIRSEGCPFNEVVVEHPETCIAAESLIEEIVGKPVREVCDRQGSPKCRFEIDTNNQR